MALIGFMILMPTLALFYGVCCIAYLSIKHLYFFGVIPIIFICIPGGYGLLQLMLLAWSFITI